MKSLWIGVLAVIAFLALPVSGATQEKKPVVPKDFLKSLEGAWEGTVQTWFKPGTLEDESRVTGEFKSMLNGRVLRHTYDGSMKGKPRHGEETIAFNSIGKRFQVSWLDDFHTGSAILFSEGEPTERGFVVKGKYDAAPNTPMWGWNTVYELTDDDHLTITSYNVPAGGQEYKGIETKYVRHKR